MWQRTMESGNAPAVGRLPRPARRSVRGQPPRRRDRPGDAPLLPAPPVPTACSVGAGVGRDTAGGGVQPAGEQGPFADRAGLAPAGGRRSGRRPRRRVRRADTPTDAQDAGPCRTTSIAKAACSRERMSSSRSGRSLQAPPRDAQPRMWQQRAGSFRRHAPSPRRGLSPNPHVPPRGEEGRQLLENSASAP